MARIFAERQHQELGKLKDIFVGNFQGPYVHVGNSWDLKSCKQKANEILREYIRLFSQQCNELPDIVDADVVAAFLSGTTCRSPVHKLGYVKARSTKELLDIVTNHAFSEEAVGAIFIKGEMKKVESKEVVVPRRDKKKKDGNKRRSRVSDDDSELVAEAECDGKWPARPPTDHFEKLLKKSCSNHAGPVRHLYKDYSLLKQFLRSGLGASSTPATGSRPAEPDHEVEPGFPETTGCLMIYGGVVVYESWCKQKLTARVVNAVSPATSTFLRWFESAITFDRADHPDRVPQPERFPLVVDPIAFRNPRGSRWLTPTRGGE